MQPSQKEQVCVSDAPNTSMSLQKSLISVAHKSHRLVSFCLVAKIIIIYLSASQLKHSQLINMHPSLAKLNFKYYGFITLYTLCIDYKAFSGSFPIRFLFETKYVHIIDDSVEFG